MIFPERTEEKIGFAQVRLLLLQEVLSPLGENYIHKIRFSSDFETVERMLKQTKDFKDLLQFDQPFPTDHYIELRAPLAKMKLEGAWLTEEEFFSLLRVLNTMEAVYRYFEQRTENYGELQKLFTGTSFNSSLGKLISAKIDEEGNIRPNASAELASIIRQLGDKERDVRRRLNAIYKKAQDAGWVADSGITVRNDRLVIPVLAEHKKHLKGFVHDESATAQTFYIEPVEVFELHNEIREWQLAKKREIERILTQLTNEFRPHAPELELYQQKLAIVDFIRAKAKLAIKMEAQMPMLQKQPVIKLQKAYHPLLWLHHKKVNKPIVPLSVELDTEQRILVISGPNAGGKSVCLKTIALLQYMLQCGLLIPAQPHSVCGIFQDMLVNIGDDQSIENDLSTYSSHLQHMKFFMEHAGKKTLFFIDEFGTGTDPQFGGPIAESVLLQLVNKQAFGVVTTHYSNIKTFANNTKGMLNASMLFDSENMVPLYVLEIGKPGSSHAFEIAQRTGFPKHILDYARARSGHKQLNVDDLLLNLQQDRIEINRLKEENEKRNRELHQLLLEYNKKNEDIQQQKKILIQQAKEQALQLVKNANSLIEQTIREIKTTGADQAHTKQVREELKQFGEGLKKELAVETAKQLVKETRLKTDDEKITVGCFVKIKDNNSIGQLIELNRNRAVVSIGELRTTIDLSRLQRTAAPTNEKNKPAYGVTGLDMTEKYRGFTTELNIIGERGGDALRQLKLFIDEAYLLGFKNVRIVHGKGDGILRKLVSEELKRNELVVSFNEAHAETGGAGATVVEIK